jgi:hypothetical protein
MPAPPWDYDALQALRSPHDVAQLAPVAPGDAQTVDSAVAVVGTATFAHPPGLDGPASIGGIMIVQYGGYGALLYQCVTVDPPAVTSPDAPTVSVPVTLWDSFPQE